MSVLSGRRERNKEEKRERILAVASELFATHCVDEVTTQQVAQAADIGAGTLFLYAKNKGELLLMVQNVHYEQALEAGVTAAKTATSAPQAVMAILSPVVACNRAHVANGRIYLREMVFGDPTEPHHARAIEISMETEAALSEVLKATTTCTDSTATSLARALTALLLRHLATPEMLAADTSQILEELTKDVKSLLAMAQPA